MDRPVLTVAAIVIFIPDFIMLFALRNVIYSVTIIYFTLLFTATFIIMKLVKIYGVLIFLLSILAVLLLYIKTFYSYTATVSKYFFYLPNMPISNKIIFTFIILLVIFFIIQGLFSRKFWALLSYYFMASGVLLLQMATLAYMRTFHIGINITSYLVYFGYIMDQEHTSIVSLMNHGYQTYLPLYRLSLPMALPLSAGFAISVLGSILWLYLKDSKTDDNIIGSFSIIIGLAIGFIFFISLRYIIPLKFEFLYIAIAFTTLFIIISYSNKKGRDIYTHI